MMRMGNERYDRAIRALLCGTSMGRPLSRLAISRILGDDDLTSFISYISQSAVGRFFSLLTDGKSMMLGVSSKALLATDSTLSNQALCVFLYILKNYQDNSMPVPQSSIVEQFVASERSAARLVKGAIEDLKRVFWIDEVVSGTVPDAGGGLAFVPTPAGVQSLGPRFLSRVIAASQGREFKPGEVTDFFQTGLVSLAEPDPLPMSLFDTLGADPRYERVTKRIIVGTAGGKPPTIRAVLRDLGADSTKGLEEYWLGIGLDGFLRFTVFDGRVMALVESEGSYRTGSGPLTPAALAIAAYAWYLEKGGQRWLHRSHFLCLAKGRAKQPGRIIAAALTLLCRKSWMETNRTRRGYRLSSAGKACLALAFDLSLGCDIPSVLDEFVADSYASVLAADGGPAKDVGMEDGCNDPA